MSEQPWMNWSGRQRSSPTTRRQPTAEREFAAAVAAAGNGAGPVRAVGASHSHSRVAATDGVLVDTDLWTGLVAVNLEAGTATLRSGTRIHAAGPILAQHGLALRNQGDIDKQSIAGAVSTGTHGTGPALQNLSASVRGLRLVLAGGDIVTVGPDVEPELFAAARLSLGGIGLISEVELAVRDAYRLHETEWYEGPEEVLGRLDELVAATRHFEFFWAPSHDVCACKSLAETTAEPDDLPDVERQRIGWSHNIISSIREDKHTEMEYSIPAELGPACFAEIRELINAEFPELQWPVEYRTLASDDLWISTATGRETVTISLHEDVGLDDRPLFEAAETVFLRHDGRPHWGKVHYRTGADLAASYPRYQRWWEVRDGVDPEGVFLTPDLEALRPGTS